MGAKMFLKVFVGLAVGLVGSGALAQDACPRANDAAIEACEPESARDQRELSDATLGGVNGNADALQSAAAQTVTLNQNVAATAAKLAARCEGSIVQCERECAPGTPSAVPMAYSDCHKRLRGVLHNLSVNANSAAIAAGMAQRSAVAASGIQEPGRVQNAQFNPCYGANDFYVGFKKQGEIFKNSMAGHLCNRPSVDSNITQYTVPP